jgi:hypothetical protein
MNKQVKYFSNNFQQSNKNTLTHLQGYHSERCYKTLIDNKNEPYYKVHEQSNKHLTVLTTEI